jgi:NAD-specific glutamate dehydrogenase
LAHDPLNLKRPLRGTHPLRREIITTSIVNEMVNTSGITFPFRLIEELARPCLT